MNNDIFKKIINKRFKVYLRYRGQDIIEIVHAPTPTNARNKVLDDFNGCKIKKIKYKPLQNIVNTQSVYQNNA